MATIPVVHTAPCNLDFESGIDDDGVPVGWWAAVQGAGYRVDRDDGEWFDGTGCGRVTATKKRKAGTSGGLMQTLDATAYRGRRVRLTGYLATDEVTDGTAQLFVNVIGPENSVLASDAMVQRAVFGTSDWTATDIVIDVPETAQHILLGMTLTGAGTAYCDQLTFVDVGPLGEGPALTADALRALPVNLDLSAGIANGAPAGWGFGNPNDWYSISIREERGAHVAVIEAPRETNPMMAGMCVQNVAAEPHRKRIVALSGEMRCEGIPAPAFGGLFLGIGAADNTWLMAENSMGHKPTIRGTLDWTPIKVQAVVATEAERIGVGFHIMGGGGRVEVRNLRFRDVGAERAKLQWEPPPKKKPLLKKLVGGKKK